MGQEEKWTLLLDDSGMQQDIQMMFQNRNKKASGEEFNHL